MGNAKTGPEDYGDHSHSIHSFIIVAKKRTMTVRQTWTNSTGFRASIIPGAIDVDLSANANGECIDEDIPSEPFTTTDVGGGGDAQDSMASTSIEEVQSERAARLRQDIRIHRSRSASTNNDSTRSSILEEKGNIHYGRFTPSSLNGSSSSSGEFSAADSNRSTTFVREPTEGGVNANGAVGDVQRETGQTERISLCHCQSRRKHRRTRYISMMRSATSSASSFETTSTAGGGTPRDSIVADRPVRADDADEGSNSNSSARPDADVAPNATRVNADGNEEEVPVIGGSSETARAPETAPSTSSSDGDSNPNSSQDRYGDVMVTAFAVDRENGENIPKAEILKAPFCTCRKLLLGSALVVAPVIDFALAVVYTQDGGIVGNAAAPPTDSPTFSPIEAPSERPREWILMHC